MRSILPFKRAAAGFGTGLVLVAIIALIPASAQADPHADWVRNYSSGQNPEFAFAYATAVDASGDVYVTGSSYGANGQPDYATIKYSSSGDTLWVQRYNGPEDNWDVATELVLDDAGNVYVTGHSYGADLFDYVTIKYSPGGAQEWVARYNGVPGGDDWPTALTVDASGNVYVTGYSGGSGTFIDYATVKYDSSGVQQWATRYNGPGNTKDRAWALAVDGAGNVYVTGDSGEGSENFSDYVTVKYSSSGVEQWAVAYDNWYDYATDLALDPAGNVYVTGYSHGFGTSYDYLTVSYDPLGNQRWLARFHGGLADDYAYDLTTDASGNAYVTGETVAPGTGSQYGTIKYDAAGVQEWVARYDAPDNPFGSDRANAVAVDPAGNVYVTGESDGSETETDYATVKYDASGRQQWAARFDGPGDSFDMASALAVDAAGEVFVTGRSSYVGGSVFTTIKYSEPPPPPPPPPPPAPPPPPPPVPPPPPPPPGPPQPVRCRVPRVMGLMLGRARTRIRRAHCAVGRVRRAPSRRLGRVIAQHPHAGTLKRRGFPVALVVGRRR